MAPTTTTTVSLNITSRMFLYIPRTCIAKTNAKQYPRNDCKSIKVFVSRTLSLRKNDGNSKKKIFLASVSRLKRLENDHSMIIFQVDSSRLEKIDCARKL